ncbi:ABC transporter ATP-binding protein [Gleimia hominis]|uniref:ABC transporter ATP-binding protein n=1 Tax=Gleimia hominis TaxID=595468 RepID=UPI000C80DDDE|nr:ABC transporter ATP-binding protein [Gleimia hominis]WIK64371.1 ABC transporter ATP-binding protein [Gleimia hominis]
MAANIVATLRGVKKIYGSGRAQVNALNGVDLQIHEGQFTVIMGPSGSGKSTLLHVLAGLDSPSAGTVEVGGKQITNLKDKDLTHFRRDNIGFVFQAFNLIPTLNARDNITLPMKLAGREVDMRWFKEVVLALGLGDRLTHKPFELSGGQQQRVAVARALVARPKMLVADEPTGNLDSKSSHEVLSLLRQAVDVLGQTVVMVTHDRHAAALGDRVLIVKDGLVTQDLPKPTVEQIEQVA